jgi:hypothetical protein
MISTKYMLPHSKNGNQSFIVAGLGAGICVLKING